MVVLFGRIGPFRPHVGEGARNLLPGGRPARDLRGGVSPHPAHRRGRRCRTKALHAAPPQGHHLGRLHFAKSSCLGRDRGHPLRPGLLPHSGLGAGVFIGRLRRRALFRQPRPGSAPGRRGLVWSGRLASLAGRSQRSNWKRPHPRGGAPLRPAGRSRPLSHLPSCGAWPKWSARSARIS